MSYLERVVRTHPRLIVTFLLLVLLVLWQLSTHFNLLDVQDWASPSKVAAALAHDFFHTSGTYGDQNTSRTLLRHILTTLLRFSLGFFLASIIGVTGGFILGISQTCRAVGFPITNLLRSLPSAAIWPVCGIVLGYGAKSQLLVIVFGAMWPVLFNTMDGVRLLPQEAYDSLRFMRLRHWQRGIVLLRWAIPNVFTGFEISCAIAFLLAVTVEIFWPANGGIGWYLKYHQEYREQPQVFGGLVVAAALGFGLNSCVSGIGRKLIHGRRENKPTLDMSTESAWKRLSRRETSALAPLLTANRVTEVIQDSFGSSAVRLHVLYQGGPYMVPREIERFFGPSIQPAQLTQRDIVMKVRSEPSGNDEIVLFARSWINLGKLTQPSVRQLKEQKLAIGQILRGNREDCSYKDISYYKGISAKLSAAFERGGTIELVERLRCIRVGGEPAVLIQEFVPAQGCAKSCPNVGLSSSLSQCSREK